MSRWSSLAGVKEVLGISRIGPDRVGRISKPHGLRQVTRTAPVNITLYRYTPIEASICCLPGALLRVSSEGGAQVRHGLLHSSVILGLQSRRVLRREKKQ